MLLSVIVSGVDFEGISGDLEGDVKSISAEKEVGNLLRIWVSTG